MKERPMTTATKVVRYTTKPECADDNARLIEAVFAELADNRPEGLHYTAFRLDDGVTFLHVAVIDGEDNPLAHSLAFGEFQSGIAERVTDGPVPSDATVVGSYRMLPG
jgi:hypothetical protein